MNIGSKIKTYRKQAGLTQQQVADHINVSYQAVSCWENDEYMPDMSKLQQLAGLLGIPITKILGEDYAKRWELHDRMFSEEHMYTFVRSATHARKLPQSAQILPLVKKFHENQVRKGSEKVPYIYHPLMLACHALALGFNEDELIATALLHDVIEDCDVSVEELPVSNNIRQAVVLLSFRINLGEDKESAKKRYYKDISSNRLATIVKVLDRCNNISSMALAFTRDKMAQYIDETERYIMPLLNCMKSDYPECYNAAFLLKYHMLSVLETLKRTL